MSIGASRSQRNASMKLMRSNGTFWRWAARRRYTENDVKRIVREATEPLIKGIEKLERQVQKLQHENDELRRENAQLKKDSS